MFLGRAWNADANFIGLASGQITTARAIARTTLPERWSKERLQRVSGTPINLSLVFDDVVEEDPAPHRGPDHHRHDGPGDDKPPKSEDVAHDDERSARRMPILRRDLIATVVP